MSIRALIVKIGADTQNIDKALQTVGASSKNLADGLKKLGDTEIGKQAQQDADRLKKSLDAVMASNQRVAQEAVNAAAAFDKLGGVAGTTDAQMKAIAASVAKGVDAFRVLGQSAPADLKRVSDAIAKQQSTLSTHGASLDTVTSKSSLFGAAQGLLVGELAAVAGPAALGVAIHQAIAYADTLTKMSDKTGIGVVALQRLDAIAGASGNSIEELSSGINQFQKRLATGDAEKGLTAIGESIQSIRDKDPDQQFIAIARGIQRIKDPADQVRIAMELFGKSGAELLPSLKANVDELANSTFTMSKESVKALDDFGDSIARAKTNTINFLGELAGKTISVTLDIIRKVRDVLPTPTSVGVGGQGFNFGAAGDQRVHPSAAGPLSSFPLASGNVLGGAFQGLQANIGQVSALADALDKANAAFEAEKRAASDAGLELDDYRKAIDAVNQKITQAQRPVVDLTKRQHDLVETYKALGLSNAEIALKLGVSTRSVDAYERALQDLFDRMASGARVNTEAATSIGKVDLGYVKATQAAGLLQRATLALTSNQVRNAAAFEDADGTVHLYAETTLTASDTVEKFNKHLLTLKDTTGEATGPMEAFRKEEDKAARSAVTVSDALSSLSGAFSQMAQVGGDSFGGVAKGIGEIITGVNTAIKATEVFKASVNEAGHASTVATIAAAASWVGLALEIASAIESAAEDSRVRNIMDRIGFEFGVTITDGMARAIREQATTLKDQFVRLNPGASLSFGGARNRERRISDQTFQEAAATLSLNDLISQAGGLNADNLSQFTQDFRRVFDFLHDGLITSAQAAHVLDENFASFAEQGTDNAGLLNNQLREFIRLNDEAGTHSRAIRDFASNQLNTNVVGGFRSALSPTSDASRKAEEDRQRLIELTQQLGDANDETRARIQRDIEATNRDLQTQQRVIDTTQIHSQAAAQGIAGGIVAAFTGLQQSGASVTEALAAVAPEVTALQEQLTRTGFDGGAAFQSLQGFVALASDEIAGPALNSVGGLGQALVGLNNTGLLTQDTFTGITDQVTDTFNSLVDQGKNGNDALRLMQPTLQRIFELQQDFGFQVDSGTQALLDQAQAAGIVGDRQRPIQERQLEATQKIVEATERVAHALESLVPAANTAADGMTTALSKIRTPDLSVKVHFDVDQFPDVNIQPPPGVSRGGVVTNDGIQFFGSGGVVLPFLPRRRGSDTVPAMLTPGEVVLNRNQQDAVRNAMGGATVLDFGPRLEAMANSLDQQRRFFELDLDKKIARAVMAEAQKLAGRR